MSVKVGAQRSAVRGMPIVKATAVRTITRTPVPVELEKIELPMNTFTNKNTFKAKIKSVERIVGPKATGETCHIIIETDGKIPFWEGQSYGVIPPVILNLFSGSVASFLHSRCQCRRGAPKKALWFVVYPVMRCCTVGACICLSHPGSCS